MVTRHTILISGRCCGNAWPNTLGCKCVYGQLIHMVLFEVKESRVEVFNYFCFRSWRVARVYQGHVISSNDPKLTAFWNRSPRCFYAGGTFIESCEVTGRLTWAWPKKSNIIMCCSLRVRFKIIELIQTNLICYFLCSRLITSSRAKRATLGSSGRASIWLVRKTMQMAESKILRRKREARWPNG